MFPDAAILPPSRPRGWLMDCYAFRLPSTGQDYRRIPFVLGFLVKQLWFNEIKNKICKLTGSSTKCLFFTICVCSMYQFHCIVQQCPACARDRFLTNKIRFKPMPIFIRFLSSFTHGILLSLKTGRLLYSTCCSQHHSPNSWRPSISGTQRLAHTFVRRSFTRSSV